MNLFDYILAKKIGGGGGSGIPLISRTDWEALSTAQKQAYGLVAVQDSTTGYDRGELYNGAYLAQIIDYLPYSNPSNIACFARIENFDQTQLFWGEGDTPIVFSAATTKYQSEDAVYFDSKTSSKKFSITLPSFTSDFTLYCVSKGLAYVSGDVIVMGSVYSWGLSNLAMLYHRSGSMWRTSTYGSDTDLIDTQGDYVVVAMRSASMKASWFANNGTTRTGVSYNNHGREFTFGSFGTGNYHTDLAVKFVGMSTVAESDGDIMANIANLAEKYGLT